MSRFFNFKTALSTIIGSLIFCTIGFKNNSNSTFEISTVKKVSPISIPATKSGEDIAWLDELVGGVRYVYLLTVEATKRMTPELTQTVGEVVTLTTTIAQINSYDQKMKIASKRAKHMKLKALG
jgi:hypothetical protein